MKRTRGNRRKYVESSDSENETPPKRSSPKEKTTKHQEGDSSSSESDIEAYLQKPEKLDFNSDFFNTKSTKEFEDIEKKIFSGFTKLSDSESDEEPEQKPKASSEFSNDYPSEPVQENEATTTKINFDQLQDFTKKIEEAKKEVELYKARKHTQENSIDVSNLLAAGEKKLNLENITPADLHSSDFESCDSEQEWEEIKSQEPKEKSLVPNKGLQIVVDMPDHVKKKKGVDLVTALKRRLNRIRKENQVLIHRVHLLSYIAHGNYVNAAINDTNNMALALSLLPSKHCYPPSRRDLSYLEQIVAWYKRTIINIEKPVPTEMALDKCLEEQIQNQQAYNKKMLALIFVIILRSLGIQTRLVISLQVEPLRPPASELHSLSSNETSKKSSTKKNSKPSHRKNVSVKNNNNKSLSSVIDHDIPSTSGQNIKKKLSDVKISVQKPTPEKNGINSNSISGKLRTRTNNTKLAAEKKGRTKSRSLIIKLVKLDVEKPKRRSKSTESVSSVESQKTTKTKGKSADNKQQKSENHNTKSTSNKSKSAETLVSNLNGKTKEKPSTLKADAPSTRKRAKSTESLSLVESRKTTRAKGKSADNVKQNSKDQNTKSTSNKSRSAETLISNTNAKTKQKTSTLKTDIPRTRKRAISTESIDSFASNSIRKSTRISSQAKKPKNDAVKGEVFQIKTTTTARKLSSTSKSSDNKNPNTIGRGRKVISQLDGLYDSDSDVEMLILQVDGSNDDNKGKKPNLKKPAKKVAANSAAKKTKAKPNFKSAFNKKSPQKTASESESEFEPANWSPFKKRLERAKPDLDNSASIKTSKKDVKKDIGLMKDKISKQKQIERSRLTKSSNRKSKSNPVDTDSDSDYAPEPAKKKHHESEDDFIPKTKVKKRIRVPENEPNKKKKFGNDVWVEVFLEAEEKWISVDVVYGQVHCVNEIAQRSTHPLSYVLAWDNNNKVKDVTQRYCPNFNTVTRKLRIDQKWWMESLKPFMGISTARDKEEDEDLARLQLDQPLPKSISEYKNHPLYVLERHLLKYEAIYPPEPTTLGFIRGEAVYPRTCVYTLHSRQIWRKEAKTVKLGEEPYKMVKANPRWDKLSRKVISTAGEFLEVFGPWQVEDYDPPAAENGVVPRNEFGNVELFKTCMLPKGCVHLKLPGLNKIAKRMDIDCASAIVGFDCHGGWSHPLYDGFVVCREFEDKLICAWELEQEELDKKEQEKIDKRVYGNWKKLIRGLLIRERLKARYDFGGEQSASTSAPKVKDKNNKGPTFVTKKSIRK